MADGALLSVRAAARRCGVHPRTYRRWCELGVAPCVVVASVRRVPARALTAWLARLESEANAAIDGQARVSARPRFRPL